MNQQSLISADEFCVRHQIEISFLTTLHEYGLVNVISREQTVFIKEEELPRLEQILLFNKDLDINLEGVEVIVRLLDKVQRIQEEMNYLKNKLRMYEK